MHTFLTMVTDTPLLTSVSAIQPPKLAEKAMVSHGKTEKSPDSVRLNFNTYRRFHSRKMNLGCCKILNRVKNKEKTAAFAFNWSTSSTILSKYITRRSKGSQHSSKQSHQPHILQDATIHLYFHWWGSDATCMIATKPFNIY